MNNAQKTSYRPFWITFISTLIILGSFVTLFFYITLSRNTAVNQQNVEVPVTPYIPVKSDSRNILLIGCTERSGQPSFYILLRFDAPANRCYVLSIPPEAESTVNVKTMSLAQHYEYGSSKTAAGAVESLFLTRIDQYIRMDTAAIAAMFDFFGGLEYAPGREIKTPNYEFTAENQLLDGARAAELMLAGDMTLSADLLNAYLETHFNESMEEKQDSFFNIIFNQCDTELTALQLRNSSEMLSILYSNPEDKSEILTLDGEYYEEEDGKKFIPDPESMEELKQLFP